jgi:hypothetical protein
MTPSDKKVEELTLRLKSLEKANHELNQQIRRKDSIAYSSMREDIYQAFLWTTELQVNFKNTNDKMAVTGLFARLMQANNPTSDILGFRFSEIVFAACEKHFLSGIKDEKEKKRFGQILHKIINNPIVSSLTNSNPVTSIIGSIINTIASFTTSSIEILRDGNKIKNVDIVQKDLFKQESIAIFRDELQVYINFYEALTQAAEQYLQSLEKLQIKYSGLVQQVNHYQEQLYEALPSIDPVSLEGFNIVLPDPSSGNVNFSDYNYDSDLLQAHKEAIKYHDIRKSVMDHKREYHHVLTTFLKQYLAILELTKNFPEGIVDPSKINQLIAEIEEYVTSYSSASLISPEMHKVSDHNI